MVLSHIVPQNIKIKKTRGIRSHISWIKFQNLEANIKGIKTRKESTNAQIK